MSDVSTDDRPLGDLLRDLRNKAGLSQEAWSARLKLDRGYYGLIETGRRVPSRSLLAKIAAGVDLPLNQLESAARRSRQGRVEMSHATQLFVEAMTTVAPYLDDEGKADVVRYAHERAYRTGKDSST